MFTSKLSLSLASASIMIGLSASSALPAAPSLRQDPTGKVKHPGRRYRISPTYIRKTPSTPADFEALAKAQAKRDRKAAKLMRHGL